MDEIKEETLETGMRGVPVGYCITSTVDPQAGLFYCGIPVKEMVDWSPEKVIYLLFHGKEGSKEEILQFSTELKIRGSCSSETISQIRKLPKKSHPMQLFTMALLLCGAIEEEGDWHEDCLNIIAKAPQLAANAINYHAGWEPSPHFDPNKDYIENFAYMLNMPGGVTKELLDIFRLFNILHYDHGGGNLSAFVGKAIASGLEDMYGSLAGAMCALAGSRHGRANQDCLRFVETIEKELGDTINSESIEALIRKRLEQGELLYGFGHAVLRVEDPRATQLYAVADNYYAENKKVKIAHLLRETGTKILKENEKISSPYPNVDAISGVLLHAAGFPYPEYYTVLFGLARVVGISIQIVYERCDARHGKGTPIVRPKYIYRSRFEL